jgi:ribosome-binding protein aMBF1 (putative translation factor)
MTLCGQTVASDIDFCCLTLILWSMKAKDALRLSGENLHTIRNGKGFSLETLAILSQVDAAVIGEMEAGNFDFPMDTIYELAAALNVDLREIMVDPMADMAG